MVKLSQKLSYWVMYALFIIGLVVLGLFYFAGYNNPMGEYNAPENTDALIYLMYFLLGLTIALTVIAVVIQFAGTLKDNPKSAIQSILGIILLIVVVGVAYAMGSDAPMMTGTGLYEDGFWLKITDTMIYSIYALMGIAILSAFISMTGILKK